MAQLPDLYTIITKMSNNREYVTERVGLMLQVNHSLLITTPEFVTAPRVINVNVYNRALPLVHGIMGCVMPLSNVEEVCKHGLFRISNVQTLKSFLFDMVGFCNN